MTRAPVDDQVRLLRLQELDTALAQLDTRRRSLPEAAEADRLSSRVATIENDVVILATRVSDLDREIAKAEREVEQVRARADRDRRRLDEGAGRSKDIVGLEHELESLARRQRDLEDAELEVLERREADEASLGAKREELTAATSALEDVAARRDEALAAIRADVDRVTGERRDMVARIDSALVAMYEKLRATRGGVGAARLEGTRCGGCRLDVPPSDLADLRTAPEDEVARCEECGRILVRAADGTGS